MDPFFFSNDMFSVMQLTTDDLLQAAQIEERGMLDRKDRSSETWRQVAINEAAMAVVAVNFPDLKNIEFVGFFKSFFFLFPLRTPLVFGLTFQ